MSLASRLYHGETSYDVVGRRRLWFTISAVLVAVSLISLVFPGLNFGIDFKGGAVFRVQPTRAVTEAQVRDAVGSVAEIVQITESDPVQVSVQTEELPPAEVARIRTELAQVAGVERNGVSTETIGSKWGSTVSRKAVIALLAFLVAVTIYVSLRMEFKMAVAALVALLHDLIITAGIFALSRFEVTPATVIALLTILGYSLYDTVVVFDKVRENTGPLSAMSRTTYSQATNLAVNQTMMRSLNTSLASLLPILGLLLVGNYLLGAETLKDLALALFIGVAAGAYSSIFLAPPLVAMWKEKEPRYAQLRARVERLAAQGGVDRPERPERPVRAGGGQARRPAGGARRRPAAPPPEAAPELPELPPDDELAEEPALAAEPEEEPVEERAVVAQAPTRRQPQKPRPNQQRRKPSGRQQSRPAKRRRR
ncbi:MAG TPA: protein translocase subunit SecF [Actinomycetota bacterium]|nr:protein translocase subunit SecF [Actinomycetota bacterium]